MIKFNTTGKEAILLQQISRTLDIDMYFQNRTILLRYQTKKKKIKNNFNLKSYRKKNLNIQYLLFCFIIIDYQPMYQVIFL